MIESKLIMGGSTGTGRIMTPVIVSGLPGKMSTDVAKKLLSSPDFFLWGYGLTGPEITKGTVTIEGEKIHLYNPTEKIYFKADSNFSTDLGLVVDFSHPSAVNDNANYYCENGMNFVMGTTGGDRSALEQRVRASQICAVIAPNMAPPIVSLQEFMQNFARIHENEFKGYSLAIIESHQKGKADTSGTAKAMVQYYNKMGIPFDVSQIKMIREPTEQILLGVPEEFLGRHGWHSYYIQAPNSESTKPLRELNDLIYSHFFVGNPALRGYEKMANREGFKAMSPDKNILIATNYDEKGQLVITHNINGGSVYADVALDGLRFLRDKVRAGEKGKVFSMIDVLKAQKAAQTLSE